jgi:hypothetical protein
MWVVLWNTWENIFPQRHFPSFFYSSIEGENICPNNLILAEGCYVSPPLKHTDSFTTHRDIVRTRVFSAPHFACLQHLYRPPVLAGVITAIRNCMNCTVYLKRTLPWVHSQYIYLYVVYLQSLACICCPEQAYWRMCFLALEAYSLFHVDLLCTIGINVKIYV